MINLIDLKVNKDVRKSNAKYCKDRKIILPTLDQMKHPEKIPAAIQNELKNIGLWEVHPRNLFRITWKNEQKEKGGNFGKANYMVLPSSLTGTKAKIIALVGKYFPTGAHKVGATYGCLAPRLTTGQFNPLTHKAVWPSTGNYCRGGAYVSALLGCQSIAILPEGMSKERFEWLKTVAGEVIATPGCESNVKEIFDKCWELRRTRDNVSIFNQFEEFGNTLWHYEVTGNTFKEIIENELDFKKGERFFGSIFSSGSAGTTAAGYFLKEAFPKSKLAVAEALQCPTLLNNGYGDHRIEGIGDKHIPWIHDTKVTDMAVAVDDEVPVRMLRLFNEEIGRKHLKENGVPSEIVNNLQNLGISSIGNLVGAIKMAKYYELTEKDTIVTVFTDSLQLYGSRLKELESERGKYTDANAYRDLEMVNNIGIDNTLELNFPEKKRVHNLKYYTWIEQQERKLEELNAQWFDHEAYWGQLKTLGKSIDELIVEFNKEVGL